MNNQKQQHKCRYCGNPIWRAFIGSIFEGWRDLYGNICNDGYKHMPEREREGNEGGKTDEQRRG